MIEIFALLALFISSAHAQCNGVFQPGTVCGNAGVVPAPPGPIPSGGSGGGGIATGPARAAIPTTDTGGGAFISSGYLVANDLGYGAPYICSGQSSTSWNAIQDSTGRWCGLNFVATDRMSVGWFGAKADNGATTITSGDISANPQWRQSPVYSVGTTWDTVGTQEAKYAAYARNAAPNSMPAAGTWNAGVGNLTFYVPSGQYGINQQIYSHQKGFVDWFAGRGFPNNGGGVSPMWKWKGAADSIMWLCDSCVYGQIFNLSYGGGATNTPSSNPVPLISLDNVGSGNSSGLKTQQLTLYDMFCSVGFNGACIEVSRSGGGAQGDTVTYINPVFLGFASSAGLILGGNNALEHVIINGDCQGFWAGSCILSFGGSVSLYGTHFENQNTDQFNFSPVLYQASVLGADVASPGGVATEVSTINGARSEGDILLSNTGGGPFDVFSSETIGADLLDWFQNFQYMPGSQVHPSVNNTKGRNFVLVNGGGTTWRHINTSSSTTSTLVDAGSPGWTVNQWVGYSYQYRYGGGGFTKACTIASNTANSFTANAGCDGGHPFDSNVADTLYMIVGNTALNASEPNWDTAALGRFVGSGNSGQGFVTQAGSNQVGVGGGIGGDVTPNVSYILIPGADAVTSGLGTIAMPLVALVTANGGPCSFSPGFANCLTVSVPAAFSVGGGCCGAAGFWGTPIADAQGKQWLDFVWKSVNPRILHGYDSNGRGFVGGTNLMSSLGAPLFTSDTIATCNSNLKGSRIAVSDATAPTYGATYVGGGSVTVPVVCDGTNWTTH
jgi:hypothetical protein